MATLRVFPTLLRVGFMDALAYRAEMLIWLLSTNTPLIMLFLWTAVANEAPIGPYNEQGFAAYFLATFLVRLLTGAWVVWELNYEIRTGSLSARLLRPLHPFWAYACENLAAWPLRAVICLPVVIIFFYWLGPAYFSQAGLQWLMFPLTLFGAWALYFSVMLCVGSLAFFWQSSLTLFEVWFGLYVVLSGYVVPLDLFPSWSRFIVEQLPFAYLLAFPVRTLLGQISTTQTLLGLGIQWLYVAGFFSVAHFIWRRGVRRYEAFGG